MSWADLDASRPPRHARVWLDRRTWRTALQETLQPRALQALAAWIAKGRAVVARRRDAGACCSLAIALPISADRARIAFAIDPRAVVRVAAPLTLHEAIEAAAPARRVALRALADAGDTLGVPFQVYGSLAWQCITGERCMTATSDVDLLWTFGDAERARRVLELLTRWEGASGQRPDGEVLLDDGGGIAWRELLSSPARVLVKRLDAVELEDSPMRTLRIAA